MAGLERASQIAFQPADVRDPAVGFRSGFQVHHALKSLDRLCQPTLFHQRVTEERKIRRRAAFGYKTTRHRFCFAEAVQVMHHMTTKQP